MESLGVTGPGAEQLDVAAESADLGLPLAPGTRFRFLKRLMARLGWTFGRHQITYNHAVLLALADLSHAIEATRSATATQVGDQVGAIQGALANFQIQLGELAGMHDLRETDLFDVRVRLAQLAQRQSAVELSMRDRGGPTIVEVERTVEPQRVDEALMLALEARFRPATDRRVATDDYLEAVLDAVGPDGHVLDAGCGQGEWLEALREAGIEAHGVDDNALAVQQCTEAGLDARCEDVIEHLKQIEEGTLAAITAFHVVEHLPTPQLVDLLDLGLRALRPGGLLVLETPNPMNVRVGAGTFWLDPTHLRPLPPALLEFIAQQRGFVDLEVRFLHPAADALGWDEVDPARRDALEPVADRLLELLSGAQDYALLARRAPAPTGAGR